MPTRKQKRRELKAKRHDYEFVYLDDDGNEVEAPEETPAETRRNGAKPAVKKSAPPARGRRTPQPPSWGRAARRAVILGAVVFVLFGMLNKKHSYTGAAVAAVLYTVLFIPFTYTLDRFAYRRWQARDQASSKR
jgi:anti-sigma factor RsiW